MSDRLRHRQVPSVDRTRHRGRSGRLPGHTLATQLANELVEAADEMTLAKTIARYGRVDLLCIDELGYMQLDRRGAELLFQVLTEREEKASVAIASNESFGGWTKTFTDPGYAQPSSTDSPSAAPSSRPAPTSPSGPSYKAADNLTPVGRGSGVDATNIRGTDTCPAVSELANKRWPDETSAATLDPCHGGRQESG